MTNLITIDNTNAVVELSTIIKFSDTTEKSLRELLLKYEEKLMDLMPFKTESEVNLKFPRKSGGIQVDWSLVRLNEEQTYFVLTLLKNTKNVVSFKHELIKQFFSMRESIQHIREQGLLEAFQEEKRLAIAEANKMNDYNGFISVGKFVKEIDTSVSKDDVWDALEFMNYSKHITRVTKYRRLHEDCLDIVGTTIHGNNTPVFTEVAIRHALNKYQEFKDMPEGDDDM